MKKIVKNAIFIVILIVIAMSIFNISYAMLNTGNFSKLATIKNTTIFTKDNNVKYSNLQSYKIENKDYNNSAYYQTIKVKKNTPYKISCMIKTNNVNVTNENKNDGAKISILNSEEESTAITGTNDWQKISLMFNSKNEENLQIAFMLGGNSEEKSAKGTVWFADFKIEEGKISSNNNWNIACFVLKNTDVNINKNQYNYEMSKNDINQINDCMKRFKLTSEKFSNGNINISYKIIEIENPIKSMSYDDEKGYYIDSKDIAKDIDKYLNQNEFDHIFVCARISDDSSKDLANNWIGLGSMEYKGIGYSNIRMPTSSKSYAVKYDDKLNQFPEEVFVHEFLHTLERNSKEYNLQCPELHSSSDYGYKAEKIKSLYNWYKDYMSCNIKNENIGLNKQIYMYKPVHESNFINSTKLNYFDEPTGTVEKIKSIINTANAKI